MSYARASRLAPNFPWELRVWEPYRLKLPRKINGRWYWPGARVYRYIILSPGGGYWCYGDDFDVLKSIK